MTETETVDTLRRKMGSAADLQSVVRTMKALAASSIVQYERAVEALAGYDRAVQLGLGACFRERDPTPGPAQAAHDAAAAGAVVFGSDQGLVGQFNEVVADYAVRKLKAMAGVRVWAIGERVHSRLADAGVRPSRLFTVPSCVEAITPLVGQIQLESEAHRTDGAIAELWVFHNRPQPGGLFEPVHQRLLPLDEEWRKGLVALRWPGRNLPEVIGRRAATQSALIREYLFISLFRACAESLAGENASRLAAMERAERNINDLLAELKAGFHRLRQTDIDEELFDVVSGFEALGGSGQ